MEKLKDSSFDFSVRLMELIKYLHEEDREFPLSRRLLHCGNGIAVNLLFAEMAEGKDRSGAVNQALAYAVESGHLLKLMAKTGYLTEQQSLPLREDCSHLIDLISDAKKGARYQKGGAAVEGR